MHRVFAVLAGVAVASSFGVAFAANGPAATLSAYRDATGGDAWNGKAVMKTAAELSGQGMTGSATLLTDLRTGNSVSHYTLGPAGGAEGFDGTNVWEQGPNGEVNLEKGGVACRWR